MHPFNLCDRVIGVSIDSSASCSISSSTTFEAFGTEMVSKVVSDSDSAILCFSASNSLRVFSSCSDNLSARFFSVFAEASNFSKAQPFALQSAYSVVLSVLAFGLFLE